MNPLSSEVPASASTTRPGTDLIGELGDSLFAFDEKGGGFDVEYGGWILSEFGWSF